MTLCQRRRPVEGQIKKSKRQGSAPGEVTCPYVMDIPLNEIRVVIKM